MKKRGTGRQAYKWILCPGETGQTGTPLGPEPAKPRGIPDCTGSLHCGRKRTVTDLREVEATYDSGPPKRMMRRGRTTRHRSNRKSAVDAGTLASLASKARDMTSHVVPSCYGLTNKNSIRQKRDNSNCGLLKGARLHNAKGYCFDGSCQIRGFRRGAIHPAECLGTNAFSHNAS